MIPIIVFVYCYGRIFHSIRRQSKVVSVHEDPGQNIDMTTTPCDQVQQHETGATTANTLSHPELNTIKTMIIVIICFVPIIVSVLQLLGVSMCA